MTRFPPCPAGGEIDAGETLRAWFGRLSLRYKFTLAALETTLLHYLDEDYARKEIPTLRMLYEKNDVLKKRAQMFARKIRKLSDKLNIMIIEVSSEIGGGSLPDIFIPSFAVALKPVFISVSEFEKRLRDLEVPIIARIEKDMLCLNMRTIVKEDEALIVKGIEQVLLN